MRKTMTSVVCYRLDKEPKLKLIDFINNKKISISHLHRAFVEMVLTDTGLVETLLERVKSDTSVMNTNTQNNNVIDDLSSI